MNYNMPGASNNKPQLRLVEAPEEAIFQDVQVNLEEERRTLEEQVEAEEYWAGRNLAGRNSTRRAA